MNEEEISESAVCGRYDDGLTIGNEADMTDERFIENLVDCGSIVLAPVRQPGGGCSWGRYEATFLAEEHRSIPPSRRTLPAKWHLFKYHFYDAIPVHFG